MALINTADKIYAGATPVDKVYAGTNLVWSSAPPLWTPSQITADLAMWLQADLLAGADLSRIDTWADSGPDGRTFTRVQTTGPQINVARLNGKKTLLFDTRSMTCAALQFTDFAVYCVWFKFSGAATQRIIDHKYDTGFWIGRHNSIAGRLASGIKQTVAPFADDIAADYVNWHVSTVSRVGSTKRIRNNGGVAEGTFAAVNTITLRAIWRTSGACKETCRQAIHTRPRRQGLHRLFSAPPSCGSTRCRIPRSPMARPLLATPRTAPVRRC
jgi:hypothetical protein